MPRGDRVEVIIGAVDRVAAPIRKINRQFETMTSPIRRVKRALQSLSREAGLNRVARGLRSMGSALSRLAIGGVAGAGVVGVALQKLASRGDDVAKLTRRLNFASDAFQEWEFAADRQGVSTSTFRRSVEALSKRVGELKAGTGALNTLLGKTDPEFAKLLASSTDTSEAFELVIKRLSQMEDPMEKAAFAAAAFSRSGLSMVQIAEAGADGIDALRNRARELGLVMSNETLAASEKMSDSLTDMKAIGLGLWQQIGGRLLPVVTKITDRITEWAVANQEWISTNVTAALRTLIDEGMEFARWVRDAAPKVMEFVESIGGIKTIAVVVAAVLGGTLLAPIVGLVATIGLIPTAIAAAIAAVVAFKDEIAAAFDSLNQLLQRADRFLDPVREAIGFTSDFDTTALAGPRQGLAAATPDLFGGPSIGGSASLVIRTDPGVTAEVADSTLEGVDLAADTGAFLVD